MQSAGTQETTQVSAEPGAEAAAPTIRRLAYSDLPAVLAIERRSFPTPWSLSMFVLELSKPSSICLAMVDVDGDELIGYLVCARYDEVWHIMNVAVDPGRRRRGIARAMLAQLFTETGARARYTLEVRVSNLVAIAMYEGLGFRSAGIRRRYYSDNREDALIMWLGPAVEPAATGS